MSDRVHRLAKCPLWWLSCRSDIADRQSCSGLIFTLSQTPLLGEYLREIGEMVTGAGD